MQRLKIEVLVPDDHVEDVLEALHVSGAGRVGLYDHCVTLWSVNGRWRPQPGSSPYLGQTGQLMHGSETKVESVCDQERARDVLEAIHQAHPYEEPVIHLIPLFDPGDR